MTSLEDPPAAAAVLARLPGGRRRATLAAVAAALLLGGLALPAGSQVSPERDQPPVAAGVGADPQSPRRAVSTPSPYVSPSEPGGLTRSAPVRVQVGAIGVDAGLVDLGLARDGTVEVPEEGFPAGWFTGAPSPGQIGPAVLIGHVDWGGEPGVFFRLGELRPGDEVAVTRADGDVAVFAVTQLDHVAKDAFPTDEVYGDIDHAGLRLITCSGAFDEASGHYVGNLVAYAELVRVVSA